MQIYSSGAGDEGNAAVQMVNVCDMNQQPLRMLHRCVQAACGVCVVMLSGRLGPTVQNK